MTQQVPLVSLASDAMILLRSIHFELCLCLEITFLIFQVTAIASDAFQQKDMDLAAAYTIADGVLQRLAHSRTEEEFENIYKQATDKHALVGLDPPSEVPGQAVSASKVQVCCHISYCWPCFPSFGKVILC